MSLWPGGQGEGGCPSVMAVREGMCLGAWDFQDIIARHRLRQLVALLYSLRNTQTFETCHVQASLGRHFSGL
jgi:hypothetical protein